MGMSRHCRASGRSAAASTTLVEPTRRLTLEPWLRYGRRWSKVKRMKCALMTNAALAATVLLASGVHAQSEIPLPEHPRPDFERAEWVNLNGDWSFRVRQGRQGRGRALVRERAGGVPAHDPRAVPVGLEAVRRPRRGRRSRGTRGPSGCRRAGRGSGSSSSSARPTGRRAAGSTASRSAATRAATRRSSWS